MKRNDLFRAKVEVSQSLSINQQQESNQLLQTSNNNSQSGLSESQQNILEESKEINTNLQLDGPAKSAQLSSRKLEQRGSMVVMEEFNNVNTNQGNEIVYPE